MALVVRMEIPQVTVRVAGMAAPAATAVLFPVA